MANAVKEPTKRAPKKKTKSSQESPWYVFCSQGCGFCKKAEPVIEELNNEGYNILKLDVAEGDNAKLAQELKTEYNTQCGTPWFINAETGKGVCGFREKDVIKKWLDGEDIPAPPQPKGMPPRPPYKGATKKEETTWKKDYNNWLKDNEHLPAERKKSADEILGMPRPYSDPPRPPMGPQATDAAIDKWGEEMGVWQEKNSHMPNMQPIDKMVETFKSRIKQMQQQGAQAPAISQNNDELKKQITSLENRIKDLEGSLKNTQGTVNSDTDVLTDWENDIEYKLDLLLEHLGVQY